MQNFKITYLTNNRLFECLVNSIVLNNRLMRLCSELDDLRIDFKFLNNFSPRNFMFHCPSKTDKKKKADGMSKEERGKTEEKTKTEKETSLNKEKRFPNQTSNEEKRRTEKVTSPNEDKSFPKQTSNEATNSNVSNSEKEMTKNAPMTSECRQDSDKNLNSSRKTGTSQIPKIEGKSDELVSELKNTTNTCEQLQKIFHLKIIIRKLCFVDPDVSTCSKIVRKSQLRLPCKKGSLIHQIFKADPFLSESCLIMIKKKFEKDIINVCSCLNYVINKFEKDEVSNLRLYCDIRPSYIKFRLKSIGNNRKHNFFVVRVPVCQNVKKFICCEASSQFSFKEEAWKWEPDETELESQELTEWKTSFDSQENREEKPTKDQPSNNAKEETEEEKEVKSELNCEFQIEEEENLELPPQNDKKIHETVDKSNNKIECSAFVSNENIENVRNEQKNDDEVRGPSKLIVVCEEKENSRLKFEEFRTESVPLDPLPCPVDRTTRVLSDLAEDKNEEDDSCGSKRSMVSYRSRISADSDSNIDKVSPPSTEIESTSKPSSPGSWNCRRCLEVLVKSQVCFSRVPSSSSKSWKSVSKNSGSFSSQISTNTLSSASRIISTKARRGKDSWKNGNKHNKCNVIEKRGGELLKPKFTNRIHHNYFMEMSVTRKENSSSTYNSTAGYSSGKSCEKFACLRENEMENRRVCRNIQNRICKRPEMYQGDHSCYRGKCEKMRKFEHFPRCDRGKVATPKYLYPLRPKDSARVRRTPRTAKSKKTSSTSGSTVCYKRHCTCKEFSISHKRKKKSFVPKNFTDSFSYKSVDRIKYLIKKKLRGMLASSRDKGTNTSKAFLSNDKNLKEKKKRPCNASTASLVYCRICRRPFIVSRTDKNSRRRPTQACHCSKANSKSATTSENLSRNLNWKRAMRNAQRLQRHEMDKIRFFRDRRSSGYHPYRRQYATDDVCDGETREMETLDKDSCDPDTDFKYDSPRYVPLCECVKKRLRNKLGLDGICETTDDSISSQEK